MRKKIACLSILAGLFVMAGTANAAPPYTNASAGAVLTIGDTAAGDPAAVTFQPSPGVSMGAFTTSSAFSINALNENAGSGDRNEYLIRNIDAGYYQMQTDTLTTLDDAAQSVTDYVYQGGASS